MSPPPSLPTADPPATANPGADPVAWPDPARRDRLLHWLHGLAPVHGLDLQGLALASADASFRRYLRVAAPGQRTGSLIVMDAPPPQEDVRPFVRVATLIRAAGLHAPQVLAADEAQGFLLLTDLGRQPYLAALQAAQREGDTAAADALMRAALDALRRFQRGVPAEALPPFDETLLRQELELFPTWCVAREHGIAWGASERRAWDQVCDLLVRHALAQPQVAVHADWMPRNLMVCPGHDDGHPGILDFQDAVSGPVGYDLASLLRDAFISWDEAQQIDWAVRWWDAARRDGLPVPADFGEFWRAVEWTGLQRHLKVLGIFCRLKHRDGKPAYAQDLPRFFSYATQVALRYRELAPLLRLLAPMSGAGVAAGFTF
jgi:aminoglycoside/choline kinase family phosphotransferase